MLPERDYRFEGRSDPSTGRSLRKLQEDPVRLASLLASANGVVPVRRRRAGFFTMSGVTIVLLMSAIEAPSLFAAVGWTGPHRATNAVSANTHTYGSGAYAVGLSSSGSGSSTVSHPHAPKSAAIATATKPPTLARITVPSLTPAARPTTAATRNSTPSPTATPTPTATPSPTAKGHGKGKGHRRS